jgi:hypothetical protein
MKKIMSFIKVLIFGVRREPVEPMTTGFHSSYPKNQPSYEEWCKQFRVSMLHDRKAIHIN